MLLIALSTAVTAQHSAMLSQYMFNGLIINPAYAGSQGDLTVNLNYRNQWTGFEGAPTSQLASIHSPLKKKDLSVGGMVIREESGLSNDFQVISMAAYKLKVDKGSIQFGIGGGIGIGSSKWSDALVEQDGDPLFQQDVGGLFRPIFSAGAYYQNRKWYAGYSMPSLLHYSYPSIDQVDYSFSFKGTEHLLTAGYVYKVNRNLVWKPSILFKAIPSSSFQFDLNSNWVLQKKLWLGLSYRHLDAMIAMVEYQAHHQLKVGYAYDYTIGPIGAYSSGSHEIMLMWVFKKQAFARNPRYF